MHPRLGTFLVPMTAMLTACAEPAAVVINPDDLLVSFQVTPDTLRAGAQVVATLTLMNPTGDTLRLDLADGCLGRARVLRWDDTPSAIQIAGESCSGADSTVIVSPGGSVVRHWTVTAWLRDTAVGRDTVPPPPGLYSVRLETPTPLPDLVAPFTLWPSGYWFGWRRCGFATPQFTDSILVSVDPEVVFGSFSKPYRVHNFTSSALSLRANWSRGTINGVQFGDGWSDIVKTVQRHTTGGWEDYSGTVLVYQHEVLLQPNECLQGRNPLADAPAGTYRIGIRHSTGYAYSDAVEVP